MLKLLSAAALIATAQIAYAVPRTEAWDPRPACNLAGPVEGAIVLAGGMNGGTNGGGMNGGGMNGGGMNGGGMNGGGMNGGGMSGGGMGGRSMGNGDIMGGGMTGSAIGSFGSSVDNPSRDSVQPDYYTYECITPASRCSFAAPAALRASSLRSGASCVCSGAQGAGRVE